MKFDFLPHFLYFSDQPLSVWCYYLIVILWFFFFAPSQELFHKSEDILAPLNSGTVLTSISPNDIILIPTEATLRVLTIQAHSRKLIWKHSTVSLIVPRNINFGIDRDREKATR